MNKLVLRFLRVHAHGLSVSNEAAPCWRLRSFVLRVGRYAYPTHTL